MVDLLRHGHATVQWMDIDLLFTISFGPIDVEINIVVSERWCLNTWDSWWFMCKAYECVLFVISKEPSIMHQVEQGNFPRFQLDKPENPQKI